jgi:hypothetical protein
MVMAPGEYDYHQGLVKHTSSSFKIVKDKIVSSDTKKTMLKNHQKRFCGAGATIKKTMPYSDLPDLDERKEVSTFGVESGPKIGSSF